ncbi:hypothetical protein HPB52_003647 [Rhipicephalus sanguineus]|uniref:F-box domain-containing protein n=1 Tax=Rhipicephalus sanguineus TaxID=34632 RepID=A0A9D4T392_RHISA|nr:hypothetical protein HPB52_003647 [Rhipicephalus sanguineus]
MSPSAEASQPTCARASPMGLLPPEVWTVVFGHLDIEPLLNMVEAVPELKCFALTPTILQRVTVAQETDEPKIKEYQQVTRQELDISSQDRDVPLTAYVHELRFTNCLALSSDAILGCAALCANLRELCCVNCVVEPGELFVLLSTRLTRVTNLEWSIHDEASYKSRLNANVTLQITGFSESEGPRIETMYVEVAATEKTASIL